MKKIKHFIDSFVLSIVIYTNHNSTLKIVKQIFLIISSINKFNFRFVRASNYIQRFNFDIRHKFDKQHIMSNVLFRLVNLNDNIKKSFDENELNALFIITLIEMKKVFRNRLLKNYIKNSVWKKIIVLLNAQKQIDIENNVTFFIEKTISFFALTIIFLITHFNFVDCAFRNHLLTKFSIHFMTLSMIISILSNVTNKCQSFISFVIFSNNYETIYVIVRIVKFIKSNDINRMIFYNQFCRFRYFFTFSLLISFWVFSNLAKNSMSLCQLFANFSNVSFAYWKNSFKQSFNESKFCWIVST